MIFLTSLMLALIFAPIAIFIAPKIGAVDVPKDERRMHDKPMPRFGGLAIFVGTMASIAIFIVPENSHFVGILVGGALIYLLGIVDDIKGLPAKVKFFGQIAVACIVYFLGIRIHFITAFFSPEYEYTFFPEIVAFTITILWIVGITNTINLIDGLDGLASGVAVIASLAIAYAAYIASPIEISVATLAILALAGSALGFLPFNFNPAKIFMGDGGSLFLGFMLAVLAIEGAAKSATVVATIAPVLVLGVPIFDTAFAILRRFINKRPIMEADKGHLHHRIMAAGFGQRRSVLMLYGISGTMGVAAVLLTRDMFVESFALLAIAGMLIYMFIADANSMKLKLKAVNIAKEEKKQRKN
jgi:UDP-GlcNAc:undecaprenyl-phosphate GlcNAc-1-phosphate transferase